MPMREINLRRWHLLLLLGVFTLWSVAYALVADYRLDQAEERITMNTKVAAVALVRANAEAAENRIQNRLRAERVAEFRQNAIRNCREIEAIKDRIRATVAFNRDDFRQQLRDLNIDPDSPQGLAILERARQQEHETIERFRSKDCGALRRP